jgi:putative glutamine amidotransferase
MTATRPVIGLPGRRKKLGVIAGFPDALHHLDGDLYLADYARSVLAAGGLPVHLPIDADPRDYVGVLDGVVLTGGADIDPTRYGHDNTASDFEGVRDAFELGLLAEAVEARLPVLGICRGLQLLNVFAGGTLHQHVPEHARYDLDPSARAHGVQLDPATRLGRLYGRQITVNTLHHQTVDRVGDGCVVAGRADDGTIEALELEGHDVLTVQWHPEMLDVFEPVWRWLVDTAAART